MSGPNRRSNATPENNTAGISIRAAFFYGLPGTGVNFLYYFILVLYMRFATDVLHVAAGVVGAIFFASKIWDAVSDPMAGYLSDRSQSRFGRRKSWLLASSVPLAVFSIATFAPPASLEGGALTLWITIAVLGFYTAHTVFEVPHLALGAELSPELRDRNRVFGSRHVFKVVGMISAFGIGSTVLENVETGREAALQLAVGAGVLTIVTMVLAVAALPRERSDYAGRGGASPYRAIADVWRNRYARILLVVFFIETLGSNGLAVLYPYIIRYVVKVPDLLGPVLILHPVISLCSVPLWLRLANHFDKHRLWLFAMGMQGVGYGLLLFIGEQTIALLIVSQLFAGTGSGCAATIGHALKADVIDYDEFTTGERKEGSYFAAWNFVNKFAGGVIIGIVGVVLQWSGFEPNVEQTATVKRTMRLLMGGLPLVGFAIGMLIFSRFDFGRAHHGAVRREIESREANAPEPRR